MRSDFWGELIAGILAIVIAAAFVSWANSSEAKKFAKFAAEHNCQQIGETKSPTTYTSGGDIIAGQTSVSWKCDDGKVYTIPK